MENERGNWVKRLLAYLVEVTKTKFPQRAPGKMNVLNQHTAYGGLNRAVTADSSQFPKTDLHDLSGCRRLLVAKSCRSICFEDGEEH